ncbi:MAG: hypothetical protein QXJ64_05980 [Thermosphaera sp.]
MKLFVKVADLLDEIPDTKGTEILYEIIECICENRLGVSREM